MHIEIRDQTLVERLNRLLPRPDSTYDDVIRALLERPCKLKAAEIAQEVVERLSGDGRIQGGRAAIDEERLRAVVEGAVAKAIESKVVEELRNAAEEIGERAAVKAVKASFKSGSFRHVLYKNVGDAAIELVEQIKDIMSQQITWSLIKQIIAEQVNEIAVAQIKEAVSAQIKDVLTAHMSEILRVIEEARNGGGGWETVIQWISKTPDKCLTFAEIKRLYGRDLNSEMLRKRGFVQRERGIWCYANEVRETPQQSSSASLEAVQGQQQ